MPVTKALIAAGSNQPSRHGNSTLTIASALSALRGDSLAIVAESRLYRSPAWPPGSGPDFVNAAVAVETALPPRALLDRLHAVEAAHGRVRERRWGPRTLDLDLIACGDAVLPDRATWARWQALPPERQAREAPGELILPHPRLAERAFVLVPLADIAPDWRHPVTGLTVAAMLAALPEADRAAIKPLR